MKHRLYLYVKAFSDFGSMLDMIVLTSILLEWTNSALWVSASLAARTFGGVLSSLSSGTIADRFDRRKVMLISDVLRALSIFLLLVFPNRFTLVGLCFALGFFGSYFGVSFSASIPDMFGEENVLATNALISRLSSISMVAGFLLAGTLTTVFGYAFVMGLDGVSYLLSALALTKMRWTVPSTMKSHRRQTSSRPTMMQDWRTVFRYLGSQPAVCIILLVYLVQTCGASSHNLGIPLLAAILSPQHQVFFYGLIWGVWGIGNVISTLVLPHIAYIKNHMTVAYFLVSVGMSAGFILFLSQTSVQAVLPLAFLTGVFDAAAGTLWQTVLQQTRTEMRGRVFGISNLMNRLGFGAGFLLAPLVLNATSLAGMVQWFHGTVIVFVLMGLCAVGWVNRFQKQNSVRHTA